jgi:hypothetical protein
MKNKEDLLRKLAECAAACEMCLDACLDEDDVKMMVNCIRRDRDCAKICILTASFIASNSPHADHIIKECEEICMLCHQECSKHDFDHCQKCAQACLQCAEACRQYQGVNTL